MDHSWLRFSTNVTIRGNRPLQDCIRLFKGLTAPPNTFFPPKLLEPLRGRIGFEDGFLRYPLLRFGIMPSRSLRFKMVESASGTELRGQWGLLMRVRIPVMIYLGACILVQAYELFRLIILRVQDYLPHLIGPTISFAMIYGWTWALVAFNRRRETELIETLTKILESSSAVRIEA